MKRPLSPRLWGSDAVRISARSLTWVKTIGFIVGARYEHVNEGASSYIPQNMTMWYRASEPEQYPIPNDTRPWRLKGSARIHENKHN